jgi:transcriptional antiterminator NusG
MDEPQQDPPAAQTPDDESSEEQMRWYVLKIQSNREKSIKEALERSIRREGMQDYFGEIVIPTEKIAETRGGKKKVITRKLYPGYIMIQMVLNDDTWYLVRGTNGVGDFTGAAGKPLAMGQEEIDTMLRRKSGVDVEPAKVRIELTPGETVKIKEGGFESFEGIIDAIDEASGKIIVLVEIFGRQTPVELEHSQVERI